MKKIMSIFFILLLAAAGGSFYGGMKYAASQKTNFGNFSAVNRPAGSQQMGSRRSGSGSAGAAFVSGEIMAKDEKSITLKLRDGRLPASPEFPPSETGSQSGSKIIFLSASTEITKSTEGSVADLQVGEKITVSGSANADGSLTAQAIQLRPNSPAPQP